MKMNLFNFPILFLFLFLSVLVGLSQIGVSANQSPDQIQLNSNEPALSKHSTHPTPTPENIYYSEEPFDLKIKKLPFGFIGNNLEAIFLEISRRSQLIKDEFETTPEFRQRMKELERRPILGSLYTNSIFSFLLPSHSIATYDADNSIMLLSQGVVLPEKNEIRGQTSVTMGGLRWKETPGEHISTGTDQPSFLAVKRTHFIEFSVSFSSSNWVWQLSKIWPPPRPSNFIGEFEMSFITHSSGIHHSFKLDRSIARVEKNNLRFLVVGKLASPPIFNGFRSEPEFEGFDGIRPQTIGERSIETKYLNLDILEIWVINAQTGDVYSKLKPKP